MSDLTLVATLVAPAGSSLSDVQIETYIDRLTSSGRKIEKSNIVANRQSADIFFTGPSTAIEDLPFDVLIQPAATRRKRLLIADMESTIIQQEMLDELAAEIGLGEKVADITRRAMNGELDFGAALTERVNLLQGQPESLLEKVAARITLMPGAQELVTKMRQSGAQCWLVSGGFTCFVKKVADQLGFDAFFANELVIETGRITGNVTSPILDKLSKKNLLEKACADYGLTLAETLAVGDGANDVPMLLRSAEGGGLGVAFHAKPKVRAVISNQINQGDLTALLYAQGLLF